MGLVPALQRFSGSLLALPSIGPQGDGYRSSDPEIRPQWHPACIVRGHFSWELLGNIPLYFVSLNSATYLYLTHFLWSEDYLFWWVYSWICGPGSDMEEGIALRQKKIIYSQVNFSEAYNLLWRIGGKLNEIWGTVGKWGMDLGFITLSSTKLHQCPSLQTLPSSPPFPRLPWN